MRHQYIILITLEIVKMYVQNDIFIIYIYIIKIQ